MKILKQPESLIFDTENPSEKVEFQTEYPTNFQPLHEVIAGGEWSFLSKNFEEKDGVQHEILKNYETSYFYVVTQ